MVLAWSLLLMDCVVVVYSVNLMTCLGSLAAIAKLRPQYMHQVVLAFEGLHGMVHEIDIKILLE